MFKDIARHRIVPVIAAESVADGLHICEALLDAALPTAEITFRTAAAADIIRRASETYPEMTIGAGTVLNVEDLDRAIQAGARFAVAPGCNPKVVQAAVERHFPFAPGVCTPSDVECAIQYGVRTLKFFPAEVSGGIPMLKALSGPYGHLGLTFVPTGGISIENMCDYLRVPQVDMIAGTWLAKKDVVAAGNWERITQLAREALERARSI